MAIIGNKIASLGGKKVSKELKITKERIRRLADGLSSCPEAKDAVKDAFPEAFEGWRDIIGEVKVYLENHGDGYRLFMDDGDGNYFALSAWDDQHADFVIPMRISRPEIGNYEAGVDSKGCLKISKKT